MTDFDNIRETGREIKEKVSGYIMAAFGFVAGLAWNDAIKALIDYLFPLGKDSLPIKFIYAIGVTVVIVIVTIYISKVTKQRD